MGKARSAYRTVQCRPLCSSDVPVAVWAGNTSSHYCRLKANTKLLWAASGWLWAQLLPSAWQPPPSFHCPSHFTQTRVVTGQSLGPHHLCPGYHLCPHTHHGTLSCHGRQLLPSLGMCRPAQLVSLQEGHRLPAPSSDSEHKAVALSQKGT